MIGEILRYQNVGTVQRKQIAFGGNYVEAESPINGVGIAVANVDGEHYGIDGDVGGDVHRGR